MPVYIKTETVCRQSVKKSITTPKQGRIIPPGAPWEKFSMSPIEPTHKHKHMCFAQSP